MATGDNDDLISRFSRWLPQGWFPPASGTRVYAMAAGAASLFGTIYSGIAYAKKQVLITTASDGFLDLASYDFFGGLLPRLQSETDEKFAPRIQQEILRKRLTRDAIDELLFEMTGEHPTIVELERPVDVGAYRSGYLAYRGSGHYASRAWRQSVFIITRPAGKFAIPNVGGYRGYLAGYRVGTFVYEDKSALTGTGFKNQQIYEALERIRAAGITYWVWINDPSLPSGSVTLVTEAGDPLITEDGQQIII